MSAEKYSQYWCLNETGWTSIKETETPSGWVRIYEEQVYQGSPFGRESRHWFLWKTNPAWSEADAEALERKHPRPEPSRTLTPEMLRALGGKQ